jgi:hypothetical protein
MKRQIGSLAAGIALLAACTGEGVSRSEFTAKADAICADANTQRAAMQEPGLLSPPYQYAKIARYSETLGTAYASALTDLRALETPAGDAEAVTEILASFDRGVGMSDEWVAASEAASTSDGTDAYFAWIQAASEGQRLSGEYGLEACARFGMP